MALNDQERKFAHELVYNGLPAAEAARRANYAESTCTDSAASWLSIGDNRYKPELAEYVNQLRKEVASHINYENIASLQQALEFYKTVLDTDMDEVMEFDGFGANPVPFDQMTPKQKATIKKFKFRKGEGTELELYSKENAAREVLKFYGAYAPVQTETKHTGKIDIEKDYSNLTDDELLTLLRLEQKANDSKGEDIN